MAIATLQTLGSHHGRVAATRTSRGRSIGISTMIALSLLSAVIVNAAPAIAATTPSSVRYSNPESLDPGVPFWDVSCVSGAQCVAVDNAGNVFGFSGRGSQKIGAGALPLYGISCTSQDFCAVVEKSGTITLSRTGERQKVIDPTIGFAGLWNSISCPSASFCVAGGGLGEGHGPNTGSGIVSMWNGRSWSRTTVVSPRPKGHLIGDLEYLSCASARFCMAGDGDGRITEWNGKTWSRPRYLTRSTPFNGMSFSCPSTRFCMALNGQGNAFTWRGHGWSAVRNIDGMNVVYGLVSCISAHSCAEVDSSGYGDSWNGHSWTARKLIDPPDVSFAGISCLPTGTCVAVDHSGNAVVIELPGHGVQLPPSCYISGCVTHTL
jgi:hypothetical protein